MNMGRSMSDERLLELARKLYGPTAFVIGAAAYCPPEIRRLYGRSTVWANGKLMHWADDNYVNGETLEYLLGIRDSSPGPSTLGVVQPVPYDCVAKGMCLGVKDRIKDTTEFLRGMFRLEGAEGERDCLGIATGLLDQATRELDKYHAK